jgi:hypothetical protein
MHQQHLTTTGKMKRAVWACWQQAWRDRLVGSEARRRGNVGEVANNDTMKELSRLRNGCEGILGLVYAARRDVK